MAAARRQRPHIATFAIKNASRVGPVDFVADGQRYLRLSHRVRSSIVRAQGWADCCSREYSLWPHQRRLESRNRYGCRSACVFRLPALYDGAAAGHPCRTQEKRPLLTAWPTLGQAPQRMELNSI